MGAFSKMRSKRPFGSSKSTLPPPRSFVGIVFDPFDYLRFNGSSGWRHACRFALIDEQGNLPVSSLEDRGGSRVELVRSARARRRHRGG